MERQFPGMPPGVKARGYPRSRPRELHPGRQGAGGPHFPRGPSARPGRLPGSSALRPTTGSLEALDKLREGRIRQGVGDHHDGLEADATTARLQLADEAAMKASREAQILLADALTGAQLTNGDGKRSTLAWLRLCHRAGMLDGFPLDAKRRDAGLSRIRPGIPAIRR